MRYIKTYKIFESDSDLRGSMDVDAYNSVREDISDILLDLTDEYYNFRTLLNNNETPATNFVGDRFSVQIYNQGSSGTDPIRSDSYIKGRFKWDDVSEYVYRIYDYMVANNWIKEPSMEVLDLDRSCSVVCIYYTGEYDEELGCDGYHFLTGNWNKFKNKIENEYRDNELRTIVLEFKLD